MDCTAREGSPSFRLKVEMLDCSCLIMHDTLLLHLNSSSPSAIHDLQHAYDEAAEHNTYNHKLNNDCDTRWAGFGQIVPPDRVDLLQLRRHTPYLTQAQSHHQNALCTNQMNRRHCFKG